MRSSYRDVSDEVADHFPAIRFLFTDRAAALQDVLVLPRATDEQCLHALSELGQKSIQELRRFLRMKQEVTFVC